MNNREIRFFAGKVEPRDVTPEQKSAGYIGAIDGFIPYGSESRELRDTRGRKFVEVLSSGVFTRSLAEESQIVFADVGHSDAQTFARSGVNLEIRETPEGVSYTALIPDTTVGRDLKENVRIGIIDGTSFEFEVRSDPTAETWEKRDGTAVRTIKDAILHRVNPVTQPAYPESTLSARSVNFLDEVSKEKPAEPEKTTPEPFTQSGARAARFGLR